MNPQPSYYNGKIKCDEALAVVLNDPIAYTRIDTLGAAKHNLLVFWIGQIFRYIWRIFGKDTPSFNLQKIVVCAVKALEILLPKEELNSFLASLIPANEATTAVDDSCAPQTWRVNITNVFGDFDYEVLSNGKILQFQGHVEDLREFCKTLNIPVIAINQQGEGIVTCTDWLLGGRINLGFLTGVHSAGGELVVHDPHPLDITRITDRDKPRDSLDITKLLELQGSC